MNKRMIPTLEDLLVYLQNRICTKNEPLAIMGGHYALDKGCTPGILPESRASFGVFPLCTMDLAAQLVRYSKDRNKDARLVMVVDDHSQMPDLLWYMHDDFAASTLRAKIEPYFAKYQLPIEYKDIFLKYSLTKKDMLASPHSVAFQESRYRQQFANQTGLVPGCAGEYRLIVEELAQRGVRTLISFIPLCCQGATCNAIQMYNLTKTNPAIKFIQVYLSSNSEHETKEEMLCEMKEKYGGIVVMSAN